MVRNYKRTTNRGDWSKENMKNAVDAVIEKRMGYLLASRTYSVPQTTLERKVKTARDHLESNSSTSKYTVKVPLGPKEQVFTESEESELCDYIVDMESRFYGLTVKDLKSLAYNLAKKNNKVHPFNTEKEEAGKDWVLGFLKRHPELSIRKPESTSAARASGFNKEVIDAFYTFLGNVYDEHQLTPDRIYNCDETGISVVPKTKSKIIAKRGRKQVGSITSAERGATITIEICFSASGNYMPPMMIFPRKRMDQQLMLNGAPGAWGVCSESGWITSELFLQWLKEFVRFSGATVDRKVLLLLDGHSTHTQNIDLINEARSNGVIILCFPPHTTHRLQVADVAFMRPLSTYYDQQITAWLRSHPGMVVTVRQVAEIFGKAFVQASTMSTAVNGFRKCGIWPYDPTVFTESDFAPSLATDIPQVQRPVTQGQTDRDEASTASNIVREDAISPSLLSSEPETSSNADTQISNMAILTEIPVVLQRPVAETPICLPVLDVAAVTSTTTLSDLSCTEPRIVSASNLTANIATSDVTSATVLTTPARQMLVSPNAIPESVSTPANEQPQPGCSMWTDNLGLDQRSGIQKDTVFALTSPKQLIPFPATQKTVRSTRKRGKTAIITASPYKNELEEKIKKKKEDDAKKEEKKKLKLTKKQTKAKSNENSKGKQKKKQAVKSKSSSENSDSEVENTPCLYCCGRYLDSNEGWAACRACGKWAHCTCAGIDDEDEEATFTCEFCQQE